MRDIVSLLDREMRRRVFWHVFIFDSGASITLGRPVLHPAADIMDAKEPLDIHEDVRLHIMQNIES